MLPSAQPHHRTQCANDARRGFTTPAVAMAMLVIMMGLALIVDRIWLETADLELTSAAEAAALAAASELASDELLKPIATGELRVANARQSAAWIAAHNVVAGSSVKLNSEPEGDIRFGNLVEEQQGIQFEESEENPTTVVVTALRTRANNNPVAIFVSGVTGLPYGDVAARVEATINNDIVGLQPFKGTPVPALPIAIWENDPTGQRSDHWSSQIEDRRGSDRYSYDKETRAVVDEPDGIPEITLHSVRLGGDTNKVNVQLLDIGTGLEDQRLSKQFESGLTVEHLKQFEGHLSIGPGSSVAMKATPELRTTERECFEKLLGERRICFLYLSTTPQGQSPQETIQCTRLVVIRVMAVNDNSDSSCDVIVQPSVLATRTVTLASEGSDEKLNPSPNQYIYKLRLTH